VTASSTPERNAEYITSTKTAVDINGVNVVAGDSILYTIKVKNPALPRRHGNRDDYDSSRVKVKPGRSLRRFTGGSIITWATPASWPSAKRDLYV